MKLNMQVWHASCARIFWKSWPWYLRSSVWQRFFGPFMGTFWGCYTRTLTLEDTFVYIYICVIICEFIELFVYVFVFLFSDVKDSFIYLFIIYLFIIYLFIYVSFTFEYTFYANAIALGDRICNWSIWCSRKMKLQQEIVPHPIYSSMAIASVDDCARPEHDLIYVMGHSGLSQNHRIPTAAVHR